MIYALALWLVMNRGWYPSTPPRQGQKAKKRKFHKFRESQASADPYSRLMVDHQLFLRENQWLLITMDLPLSQYTVVVGFNNTGKLGLMVAFKSL